MSNKSNDLTKKIRIGLWLAIALAIAAFAYAKYVASPGFLQNVSNNSKSSSSSFKIGGQFELTDQNGKPFSSDQLKGRPHLVFFGFTHCPDICPTTLQELTTHLADLGSKADDLTTLFISVDPARDTPENLKSYLSNFDKRIIGLTGSDDDIKRVAKLYRAYYEKVETTGGDYTMNHAASVYLFDRKSNLVSTLSWQEKPQVRQAKLEKLLSR